MEVIDKGKFVGLSDEQLDELSDRQRETYNRLREAAEEKAAADAEAEAASKSLHASSDGLRASQEAARLEPNKSTFLDEHRAMVNQRKIDRGIQ
ncbi:MAG: hypothetical protein ABSD31_21400 [Candidatus Binataceae bacterium]|jgi:hypothetical protein